MNLLKWNWNGKDVKAAYIYYIVNKMKHGEYILVDITENGKRIWTQDKAKACVFEDIRLVKGYIEKYFTKEQQLTLVVVREG